MPQYVIIDCYGLSGCSSDGTGVNDALVEEHLTSSCENTSSIKSRRIVLCILLQHVLTFVTLASYSHSRTSGDQSVLLQYKLVSFFKLSLPD